MKGRWNRWNCSSSKYSSPVYIVLRKQLLTLSSKHWQMLQCTTLLSSSTVIPLVAVLGINPSAKIRMGSLTLLKWVPIGYATRPVMWSIGKLLILM